MKKIFSIISAILLTISMTFVFTACDSNRPKITIVLEDGREMTFILYRDYAPITVEHFLELCSSGYYDNTAISDIASSHILAGNYEFNVDFTDLNLKNVVDSIRGEFTANGVTVENNPLLHEFGTLSLFNDWAGGVENGSKNSGSNLFFITTTTVTSYDGIFATFGKISGDDSIEVLEEIMTHQLDSSDEDITDYAYTDLNTEYEINLPADPIVIKTIKIIKD